MTVLLFNAFSRVNGDQLGRSEDLTTLNILAVGPYPTNSKELIPSWVGGPALIPAAKLAVDLINNDTSILPGYLLNLVPVDGGCDQIGTLYVNISEALFYAENTAVGIVGPGCSEATLALAPIINQDKINLMQVSIATTPEINGSKLYKNTFRTVSSSLKFIDTFRSLLKHTKWRHFAVLYDNTRRYHRAMHEEFRNCFQEEIKNKGGSFDSSGVEDFLLPGAFKRLQDKRLKIVFVFASQKAARKILCVALHHKMIFPTHQWIFTEMVTEDFIEDTTVNYTRAKRYSCSKDKMKEALNGVIFSVFRFKREDIETRIVSNISFRDYDAMYRECFQQHLREQNLNISDVSAGADRYAYQYYDATWALALGLNSSLEELSVDEQNLNLSYHYKYGRSTAKKVGDVIRKHMTELTFQGVGGMITFDNGSDRREVPSIGIEMFQVNHRDLENCSVGFYVNETHMYFNLKATVNDKFKLSIIKPPFGLGVFILIVASIMLIALATLQLLFIYHSDKKSIKASSPNLNNLIFSGSYICLLSVFSFTAREVFVDYIHQRPVHYGVLCSTFIWCNVFTFSLVFGTLCVKTWRIYRIFGFFRQGRVRYVSDGILMLFILLLLLIDFLYLLAWNLVSPWRISDMSSTSGDQLTIFYTCDCDKLIYWVMPLVTYKGALLVVVVYLSFLIRRIKRKEFDFSKYIIALIYLLLFLYSVLVPIYVLFLSKLPLISFLAQNILALTTVIASCIFLFLPPLRLAWTKEAKPDVPSKNNKSH